MPRIAEMFTLRFIEGKENPEIARLMNTTPGTVAVTLSRTRTRRWNRSGWHRRFCLSNSPKTAVPCAPLW